VTLGWAHESRTILMDYIYINTAKISKIEKGF